MLSNWLKWQERNPSPSKKFSVYDVDEHGDKNKDDIKLHLEDIFIKSSTNFEMLEKIAKKHGWEKTHKLFVKSAQPTKPKMAKGRFGEILLAGLLQEFYNYQIPIHKIAYTITKNQSLPSTDILAIKMSGKSIVEMCFVESKLRNQKDLNAVASAYDQLTSDQTITIPDMLRFVMNRLAEQNRDDLVDAFIAYLSPVNKAKKHDTFRIGAIFENSSWDDSSLKKLHSAIKSNQKIAVDIVRINDLQNYIIEFYKKIGVELDEK